ncbi:MAG: glycoside hydrolase family 3 C-terminal domain-containing protein, partial [Clostridia bacterium]|nr:glycoside hydrolase family 3 C-terminal domain-containing protein [Clostridia bacterium]
MDRKWQRITYMPATPLGEDGRRVTGCREHIALSRRAAREGMVLLKNEGGILPFASGTKLAVFGKAQADYVKGGGGSGDTTVAYVRSILDGLEEKQAEGRLELFAPLSAYYRENVAKQRAAGRAPGQTQEPPVPAEWAEQARAFTDTALIVICRFSSEGWDRTGEPFDGDFFLSREELAMVDAVRGAFPRVAVVLNTGGMMDGSWFKDDERIGAALLAWQGGMEGGSATADVLMGDENPSGHLTDTFAVDFAAYPSSAGFNDSQDYVEYRDDIFVGYRYFETMSGAKEKVCYPFGYGLSYTRFAMTDVDWAAEGQAFGVSLCVSNTGSAAGRQVAQVYCQPPQGRLGKPARVLVGFAKTKKLLPGESQRLNIRFDARDFASYDDLGKVHASAWLLEKGEYRFYVGDNVRDAVPAAKAWTLAEDLILEQCERRCAPSQLPERMLADGSFEKLPERAVPEHFAEDWSVLPPDGKTPSECPNGLPECSWQRDETIPTLIDVVQNRLSTDAFVSRLSDEQLIRLLGGQPNRGVANTFGWGNLLKFGIPNVMTADGPAGLRIAPECGVYTTAFPCATMLCCS